MSYENGALDRLVDVSGGYPYFVQVFGDQAWRAATGAGVITSADAELAVANGTEVLDDSLFHSRWSSATPAQRKILAAMSEDCGQSQIADLVARLGKRKPSDLSVARDQLIEKGRSSRPKAEFSASRSPHGRLHPAAHGTVRR